jgi:linoleoyl-CoA desaturase
MQRAPNDLRPKFADGSEFQSEVRRRVEDHFRATGLRERDCPQMYLKSAILMTSLAFCYVLLVFVVQTWWQAVPVTIILGLAGAAVGLNIQHDGIHRAYSRHAWVNRLAAHTLDLLGASSYIYTGKHVVFHHSYTNIEGADTDIDVGFFGRMAPEQPRRAIHRFQQYYMWPLYGLMAIQWHLVTDFQGVLTGRISRHHFPRPKGWDLVAFIAGKAVFFTLAFVIPVLLHPLGHVVLFYVIWAAVVGLSLAVVFQLAHCVEEAAFPMPDAGSGRIERPWAIHQVETTVDFARRNPVMAWLLGGLNFQIEHHLFPRICHVNYRRISKVVEEVCREYGVRYSEHRTFAAGLASHYRLLADLGRPAR